MQNQQQLQQQQQNQQNDFKYSSTEQISSLSASSSNTSAGCLMNNQMTNSTTTTNHTQQHYNTLPSSVNTINSSITLTNYIRSLNQQASSTTNSTHTLINQGASTKSDLNCGYISDGPHNKYAIGTKSRKLTSNDALDKSKPFVHRSLKNFFGK